MCLFLPPHPPFPGMNLDWLFKAIAWNLITPLGSPQRVFLVSRARLNISVVQRVLLLSRNIEERHLRMLWILWGFFWRVLCSVHFSLTSHFCISYLRIALGAVVSRNSCVDMSVFLSFEAVSTGSLLIGLKCVFFWAFGGNKKSVHFDQLLAFQSISFSKTFRGHMEKWLSSRVRKNPSFRGEVALQSCSFLCVAEGDSALCFTRHPRGSRQKTADSKQKHPHMRINCHVLSRPLQGASGTDVYWHTCWRLPAPLCLVLLLSLPFLESRSA